MLGQKTESQTWRNLGQDARDAAPSLHGTGTRAAADVK